MAEDKKKEKEAAPAKEASPEEAIAQSKKKRIILIGAVLAVVALGGGGAAFFLLSGGEKKKVEAPGEVPSAEGAEKPETEKVEGEPGDKGGGEKKAEEPGDKKAEGEKKADGGKKDEAKPAANAGDFGETFALKTFNLNLGNPLENHYVRLEVSFEYTGGGDQKAEIERRMPQLRDAIVGIVSRKTREFLLAPDGKHQLRMEIFTRVNRFMTKPIAAVYITDLLIE